MQLETIVTPAYIATMCLLGIYGMHRVWLLLRFHWRPTPHVDDATPSTPTVTIQLPVFNERTVAARLIRSIGALDYPPDRLEIQVLDDSTDETADIIDEEVRTLRRSGIDAQALRRADRRGFKAGALDFGLRSAKGELVCIFDADFVPEPAFLRQLVGYFDDASVGMVQARWGHKNRDESLLTRAESALLDGHFVIEHKVRSDGGLFFNFNGTAGIWRRAAIESAGGWQHDTLTEDLDLSYRAQLEGWRFVYVPFVVAPAEVPPDIAAFKSQQHRWAKGSVQVFRKLGWRILFSGEPMRVKLEALAHLTGNVGYPCVLLLSLLMPLSMLQRTNFPVWINPLVFALCTVSVIAFYARSQKAVGRPLAARVKDTAAAMLLGIGMSLSQTRAVIEGLLPGTGAFVRTPKRGDSPLGGKYRAVLKGLPGAELLIAAWFAWGIYAAAQNSLWGSIPFLLLFLASFAWVGSLSLRHWVFD